MSAERTLYEELEVIQEASTEVILAAHKALVTKYHPDKAPNATEATRKTQRINHARDVLKDPQSRMEYDLSLLGTQRPPREKPGSSDAKGNGRGGAGPTCARCGKVFKTVGGMEWHRTNNANCA